MAPILQKILTFLKNDASPRQARRSRLSNLIIKRRQRKQQLESTPHQFYVYYLQAPRRMAMVYRTMTTDQTPQAIVALLIELELTSMAGAIMAALVATTRELQPLEELPSHQLTCPPAASDRLLLVESLCLLPEIYEANLL
jgi:hypothetical protein